MKLLFEKLAAMQSIARATIVSIDMSIYQLFVATDNGEQLVWKTEQQPLIARSLGLMRELLKEFTIETLLLRHDSAYDEMINQPLRAANTLVFKLE